MNRYPKVKECIKDSNFDVEVCDKDKLHVHEIMSKLKDNMRKIEAKIKWNKYASRECIYCNKRIGLMESFIWINKHKKPST